MLVDDRIYTDLPEVCQPQQAWGNVLKFANLQLAQHILMYHVL